MSDELTMIALDNISMSVPEYVLFQKVDDEVILLDMTSGEYYGLNDVGSRMWTLFQQGQSAQEVLDALVQEYNVSTERLSNDIHQFLRQLQSRGLVEIVADCPA